MKSVIFPLRPFQKWIIGAIKEESGFHPVTATVIPPIEISKINQRSEHVSIYKAVLYDKLR
jgi:hypothetical protein